ncbi:YwmB family TATA-box binding protein [Bacillus solitudinis]|uniref:YwmB family TATA-box binding protein n=1 Tax=Bacillus solitudinis TaxID=2014074 RepID=UPI0012FD77C7|nr:YwmB family TATA-box binding protein [Bacillus solitudinis]
MASLRILLVGLIIIGTGYFHIHAELLAQETMDALPALVKLTESEGLDVQEWQLLARDVQGVIKNKASFLQHVHNMSVKLSEFDFDEPDTSTSEWQARAVLHHPTTKMVETIHIYAYPSNGELVLSYTYVIKGQSATSLESVETQQLVADRRNVLNLKKTKVFSQIQSSYTLDESKPLNETASHLVSALGAVEIEELNEETFVSISAYTDEWEDYILTDDKKMNVQVAIRQDIRMGYGTTVTIGTPIITTEY